MLNKERLAELRKDQQKDADPPLYWKAMAYELIDTLEAALKVVEAAKTVDIYFKALCEQWAANDGRVVSESGVVIDASKGVQELCERAGEEISTSLALFAEKEKE